MTLKRCLPFLVLTVACGSRAGLPTGGDAAGGSGGSAGAGGSAGTGGSSGTGGSAGTGGSTGAGGTGTGAGGSAGAAGVDAGTNDRGSPPDGGPGLVDGALGSDRSSDFVPPDAPPPDPGIVTCGTETCDTATQTCCNSFSSGAVTQACIAKGDMCMGLAEACDERSDCPNGNICCASASGGMRPNPTCTAEDMCTGRGATVLCRADADCPAARPRCCGARIPGGGTFWRCQMSAC